MSRSLGMSGRAFTIVMVATFAVSMLPMRWLGMNNDLAAIMKLPVTPLSDLGTLVASFLRPAPRPDLPIDGGSIEQLHENVDFYKQLYLAADQRSRELEEKLRQVEMIPGETLRRTRQRIPARITGRSPASSYGIVELKRGSRDGVEPGAVAVYAGVHLLGQITEDVSAVRSTLLPIVNAGTGHIIARVEPRTGADMTISERPAIQLRPAGDGTLVADADRMKIITEGDVVRLEDDTWPVTAQQMIIGRVESVRPNEREPLRHRVVVRPIYQVADVREVILLIEADGEIAGVPGERIMRWAVFALFALVGVVLDTSLMQVFTMRSVADLRPSAAIVIVTFVAMFAPRQTALWAAWVLGVLVDLSTDLPVAGGSIAYLIGPHALGYVFGAYVVLQVRAMVFRRRVITVAAMAVVAALAISLAVIAVYTIRRWYPESQIQWTQYSTGGELVRRLGMAVYTGLIAIPLGWVLLGTAGLWGFQSGKTRSW